MSQLGQHIRLVSGTSNWPGTWWRLSEGLIAGSQCDVPRLHRCIQRCPGANGGLAAASSSACRPFQGWQLLSSIRTSRGGPEPGATPGPVNGRWSMPLSHSVPPPVQSAAQLELSGLRSPYAFPGDMHGAAARSHICGKLPRCSYRDLCLL